MNGLITDAWAQAGPGAGGGQFQFALLMAAFIALFYFMTPLQPKTPVWPEFGGTKGCQLALLM